MLQSIELLKGTSRFQNEYINYHVHTDSEMAQKVDAFITQQREITELFSR